ncbi:MAG TPA: DnaA/Hda family protein [Lacipirellulaceae bacterium]
MPTFVAGPENRLFVSAIGRLLPSAANEPIAPPGAPPRVITIYGPSGVGKTHVARGLVERWQQERGAESAEYLSASDFRHQLIDAIKNKSVAEFRQRVCGRSLLVIDELDRLPLDPYLQQELRSTADAIEERGGTLLVASTESVSVLRNLTVDVASRLAAGLVLQLLPPGDAAKKQILRRASTAIGRPLSDEAAARLAAGIRGTASELFGAMFELLADRSLRGTDIERVESYLSLRAARRPTLRNILHAVAKYCAVPQKLLKSSSRRQSVVLARSIAVYLSRELAGLSYERIGAGLGGRDHSTIMHSYRKIERLISRDLVTRTTIDELRQTLAGSC